MVHRTGLVPMAVVSGSKVARYNQLTHNFIAWIRARLGPYDHVTATLKDRHWLPIQQQIVFKLCVLMHQVHIGLAPSYLREYVTASADVTSRPCLRSTSSQRCERLRTRLKFGERSFSCARPRVWNGLPSSLQELTDTKTFKRKLKTFLFEQAYNWTYVVLSCLFLFFFYYATCYVIRWSILFCKRNSLWTMNYACCNSITVNVVRRILLEIYLMFLA